MALKIRYEWRVLEGDRLEKPFERGPHYLPESLNETDDGDSFETREAAIARLELWTKKYPSREDFVLIEIYSAE